MSAMNPITFETTFTRADVRQHLRNKCANTFLKKMTTPEKNTLYQLATKTVDSEGVQVFPKPQDELKNSEWISEILGSWNRVETNYIPVSVMETIVMKPDAIDAMNQKFEAREVSKAEKKALKEATKEANKAEILATKEAEKAEKKLNKLKEKLSAIDNEAVLNSEGLVIINNIQFENDNGDLTVTMTIKDYAKHIKQKQKQENKDAEKEEKFKAKIEAAAAKLEAKEEVRVEKKAAKDALKAEKKVAKEAEKADKKLRKSIINDTVKFITDSDKRVLISDNTDWLSTNGFTASSVEEHLAMITAKDYKKLLAECEDEIKKMSWYQQNHVV
jgi:hypothetical protein